jgi:3-methylcrotonyl-CoA carboxylase alpha subunit
VLELDGERWPFESTPLGGARHDVRLGAQRRPLAVYAQGERFAVFAPEGSALATEFDPVAHGGDRAGEAGRLTAPMPGKVVAFLAARGEKVTRGQAVAVMEAMKMEHTLTAPRDGTVEALLYAVGDQVAEGGELLKLSE